MNHRCPRCGGPTDTGLNCVQGCAQIKPTLGWTCPICGLGLSPNTDHCPCKFEKQTHGAEISINIADKL